jgi:hypothetical protein
LFKSELKPLRAAGVVPWQGLQLRVRVRVRGAGARKSQLAVLSLSLGSLLPLF